MPIVVHISQNHSHRIIGSDSALPQQLGIQYRSFYFFTTFSNSGLNNLFTQIAANQTTNPGNAVVYNNPTITAFAKNVAGPGVTVNPNQSFEFDSIYYK